MTKILAEINSLIDEYLELYETEENQRRLSRWEPEICARDQWHGRARENAFRSEGSVPITIDIQNPLWIQRFPQNLSHTFKDPHAYLRFYLQKRIESFRLFRDDTPLELIIPIWMHTPFEMSLFGMQTLYFEDKDPVVHADSVVCHSFEDLDRLPPINFFKSGMMPLAHRLYDGIKEVCGNRFKIIFPEWIRGPFGVALFLRGYTNLLLDMTGEVEIIHGLMKRITDERKRYFKMRAEFIEEDVIPPGSLFNDEVDSGIIGPMHYREFIKPYEIDLGRFHKRISYWHSCGNIELMAKEIADLNYVDVLDISGWTSLKGALKAINGRVPRLDIRLHPLKDLQDATLERMDKRIRQVISLCREYDVPAVSLRVSGMQPWKNLKADFEQIQLWINTARRAIESEQNSWNTIM